MKRLSIIVAASLLFGGCGMKKMATHVIGSVATDGMVELEGEEDVAFARESSPALIKTLEVLRHGNPGDEKSLVLLSQSYGQYAFGFLEEDLLAFRGNDAEFSKARTRADLFYKRGRDYGIAALSTRGGMFAAFKSPLPDFKRAVERLGKNAVPALFWTAFNWASYLNLHLDDPSSVIDLPRIQVMIDRVLELDPGFYHGSAHSIKGVIAAMRPKMLGGDPELAQREFKEAIDVTPHYLMTRVLYAQYYARQMRDVALFKTLLAYVLEADAAILSEQRLANELAKRRARILLSMEKTLF